MLLVQHRGINLGFDVKCLFTLSVLSYICIIKIMDFVDVIDAMEICFQIPRSKPTYQIFVNCMPWCVVNSDGVIVTL